MSALKLTLLLGVSILLSTSAMAAYPNEERGSQGVAQEHQMTPDEWHRTMCVNRYARQIGRLAELEAKLNLTDKQKSLWSQWRQEKANAASKNRDACIAVAPNPKAPPTILEHDALQEMNLKAKLYELEASRPALLTLYESLSPDQKAVLNYSVYRHRHHRQGMKHHEMH